MLDELQFIIMNRTTSIIINLLIYVVALVTVIFTWPYLPDVHILWKILMADVIGTVVVFIFSMIFNNSSMYDPYWSVQPFVIAAFLAWPIQDMGILGMIVLIMVLLYAIRLTLNFYRGWPGMSHEDWRYRNFRNGFPTLYWPISFLGIHLFPTIMVFLACMSLLQIYQGSGLELNVWFIVGLLTMILAVGLAYIADDQMKKFRNKAENKDKLMREGLWKHSRHPNYLGEILTWWGLFFFSLSAGYDQWWMIAGPLTVTLMFVGISIPLLEKREMERRPGYAEYKKEVGMLFPFKF